MKEPLKADATARQIIDAEKLKRDAKTALLREARFAKEAVEGGKPATKKPNG